MKPLIPANLHRKCGGCFAWLLSFRRLAFGASIILITLCFNPRINSTLSTLANNLTDIAGLLEHPVILEPDSLTNIDKEGKEPEESVRDLLLDMLNHPYSGMVERYKRLKISRRKGNHLKDMALREGLVEQAILAPVWLFFSTFQRKGEQCWEENLLNLLSLPARGGLVHE